MSTIMDEDRRLPTPVEKAKGDGFWRLVASYMIATALASVAKWFAQEQGLRVIPFMALVSVWIATWAIDIANSRLMKTNSQLQFCTMTLRVSCYWILVFSFQEYTRS